MTLVFEDVKELHGPDLGTSGLIGTLGLRLLFPEGDTVVDFMPITDEDYSLADLQTSGFAVRAQAVHFESRPCFGLDF